MKFALTKQSLHVLNPIPLTALVFFLAVSSGFSQPTLSTEPEASAPAPWLGRGVNVLGYDPIWNSFDQGRFKERYFKMIREGGFDTLRVNLYPFRHMGAAPDFALSNSWWQTTEWVVTNALAAKLNVILDFHEYEITGKDADSNKARFLAFWRQVAPHFKEAPGRVMFEILNEPNGKMTPELWNQCLAEALAIIRETNPTRTVIIGPAFWNSIDHLAELKLPEPDQHLIVTVHYYSPMSFTHQGAPWAHPVPKLGAVWQGTTEERAAIAADFAKARNWTKEHHR